MCINRAVNSPKIKPQTGPKGAANGKKPLKARISLMPREGFILERKSSHKCWCHVTWERRPSIWESRALAGCQHLSSPHTAPSIAPYSPFNIFRVQRGSGYGWQDQRGVNDNLPHLPDVFRNLCGVRVQTFAKLGLLIFYFCFLLMAA